MSETPSTPLRPPEIPRVNVKKVGLLPLVFLFYAYTTAGPFGFEEMFSRSGPGMALLFLALVPLLWSIPMSLAAAELNSLLPVEGGFYRWVRAAFGDFWGFLAGWWNWTGTLRGGSIVGCGRLSGTSGASWRAGGTGPARFCSTVSMACCLLTTSAPTSPA